MEVTKWYCDRCGKEFIAHYKLKRIEVSVDILGSDDYMSRNGEFCNDCYNKVKEKLLSELLYKEKNVTCSNNVQVDHWIKHSDTAYECPICGRGIDVGLPKYIDVERFCRYCGSRLIP